MIPAGLAPLSALPRVEAVRLITEGISHVRVASSERITDRYHIGEVLGQGAVSQVHKCYRLTDEKLFAVKIIDKRCLVRKKQLKDEIAALGRIRHPYIVHLEEVFESDDYLQVVMEHAPGGELFDRIVTVGAYSERHASEVMEKLLSALRYLHSRGFIHRDIKPENILLFDAASDINVKLSDFGLVKIFEEPDSAATTPMASDEDAGFTGLTLELVNRLSTSSSISGMDEPRGGRPRAYTRVGSDQYTAPEILRGCGGYDEKVDIWSLGVVMHILLCGAPPLNDSEANSFIPEDWRPRFEEPHWATVSDTARDLVTRLLQPDPEKRPSAAEILRNPWISRRGVSTNAEPFDPAHRDSLGAYIRKRRYSETGNSFYGRTVQSLAVHFGSGSSEGAPEDGVQEFRTPTGKRFEAMAGGDGSGAPAGPVPAPSHVTSTRHPTPPLASQSMCMSSRRSVEDKPQGKESRAANCR